MFEASYSVTGLQEKVRKILLSRSAYNNIISIVKARYPREACGVMLGRIKGDTAFINEISEIRNIFESSYRFWFDVREWMETILKAREKGLEYIGLFHSHPRRSPIPSMADRHRMLECPEEVWIIVSYAPKSGVEMTAWRIDDWGSSIMKLFLIVT